MRRGLWLLMLAAAAAVGCARTPGARFPNPMPLPSSDPATVEKVAARVLQELRFELVYPASRPGHIVTEPLTGDSWFEFWREDTVGGHQIAESSLYTIRRTVTVDVMPAAHGAEGAQVVVKVDKERISAPNMSPGSIGQTYDIFSPSKTDLQRRDEFAETRYTWLPRGRDELLEQRILERIQSRLGPEPPR